MTTESTEDRTDFTMFKIPIKHKKKSTPSLAEFTSFQKFSFSCSQMWRIDQLYRSGANA